MRLERQTASQVDGAAPGKPAGLIDRVGDFEIAYRDDTGKWLADWQDKGPRDMPAAVRLVVTRGSDPALTLLFVVGNGVQTGQSEPIISGSTAPRRDSPAPPPRMPGVPGV